MSKMDVRIFYGLRHAPEIRIERVIDVSEEELLQFFPPSGSESWPYAQKAEAFVCSIVKEELFPDEVTPVRDKEALQRLGVTSLAYAFDHEQRGNMSSRLMYPGMTAG